MAAMMAAMMVDERGEHLVGELVDLVAGWKFVREKMWAELIADL